MSDGFGAVGSATEHHRYSMPVQPRKRSKCHCGCEARATHYGMANGVVLAMGCDLYIRRWVRDGVRARTVADK